MPEFHGPAPRCSIKGARRRTDNRNRFVTTTLQPNLLKMAQIRRSSRTLRRACGRGNLLPRPFSGITLLFKKGGNSKPGLSPQMGRERERGARLVVQGRLGPAGGSQDPELEAHKNRNRFDGHPVVKHRA